MIEAVIGAVSNAIRGGQFNDRLGGKWRWLKADYINAAIYGLTIFVMSGNWLLALASIAAMMAGATPGWGDYIGQILGQPDAELKEHKLIDPLISKLKSWPFWWGFAGLAVRGLWWGLCLATPFWFFGYSAVAWSLLASSALMPVAYWAASAWMRRAWGESTGWQGAAWGLGEIFYGAVLWHPLAGL